MNLMPHSLLFVFFMGISGMSLLHGGEIYGAAGGSDLASYAEAHQMVRDWISTMVKEDVLPSNKLSNLEQALAALEQGAAVSGREGSRALMASAALGRKDLFEFLLRCGVDVGSGPALNVLFREAVCGENISIAEAVLKKGADVDTLGQEGNTPLMLAACRNDRRMVDLLLKHGASPAAVDHRGESAVDRAEAAGHSELAQYLRLVIFGKAIIEQLLK